MKQIYTLLLIVTLLASGSLMGSDAGAGAGAGNFQAFNLSDVHIRGEKSRHKNPVRLELRSNGIHIIESCNTRKLALTLYVSEHSKSSIVMPLTSRNFLFKSNLTPFKVIVTRQSDGKLQISQGINSPVQRSRTVTAEQLRDMILALEPQE